MGKIHVDESQALVSEGMRGKNQKRGGNSRSGLRSRDRCEKGVWLAFIARRKVMIRDCPKLVGRTCYHCKKEGHMIRDCPKMKGQSKEAAVVQDTELLLVEEKPNVAR
ncbi:hypothetical protein RHMOL_Rhmol02G0128300 [Rhododendron molle]|uniref:Uncharacterized protein n=1 Tax=Rhododendron molle TaxID=49168 RepID=A0ACC0PQV7_RHOML|nr:hypothetical protein RHMOL_Rhmol02G0128300 [Rhododendron molle]